MYGFGSMRAFCSNPDSVFTVHKIPGYCLLMFVLKAYRHVFSDYHLLFTKQPLDDSFARATPKYEAQKGRQKRDSKSDSKKGKPRPVSGGGGPIVRSPSNGSSSMGPIGPSMKMRANPGMAMAMAQSGELFILELGSCAYEVYDWVATYTSTLGPP